MPLSIGDKAAQIGGTTNMISSILMALAQASVAASGAPMVGPGGSTIVMYRQSSIMGAALGCPIRYRGKEVVELGRGKFAEWHVAPGRYILNNKTSSIEVTVGPGETGYVRCQIKTGMLTGRADLQIVDRETFEEHRADYKVKELTAEAP